MLKDPEVANSNSHYLGSDELNPDKQLARLSFISNNTSNDASNVSNNIISSNVSNASGKSSKAGTDDTNQADNELVEVDINSVSLTTTGSKTPTKVTYC